MVLHSVSAYFRIRSRTRNSSRDLNQCLVLRASSIVSHGYTSIRSSRFRRRVHYTQTFAQLRFPANTADVKKRIESLIERDYLERDKDNTQVFHYLA